MCWTQLTATTPTSATAPPAASSSSAPAGRSYWHQAIDVGEHALFKGVGLLGFGVARLRYTTSPSVVSEAHGYLFETFADLGLLGVVITLALLVSWLVAASRPLALRTRTASLDPSGPPSETAWSRWRRSSSRLASNRRLTGPGSSPG